MQASVGVQGPHNPSSYERGCYLLSCAGKYLWILSSTCSCGEYFQQLLTVQAHVEDNIQRYLQAQRPIAEELASPFTMIELEAALANMKDSAAPGEDRIPAEAEKY